MFQAYLLKQDWTHDLPKYWNDNSPFKTHFLNALSLTLPECEKFFIETVNFYSKDITDANQQRDIKEFVKQESYHRNAHKQYNDWLEEQNLPVSKLQNDSNRMWQFVRSKLNMKQRLAITICVEHITVVYASVFLQHPEILKNMHPQFKQIWQWHALEEVEHKAVAMNVWNTINGSNLAKILAMLIVLPVYMWYVGKNTLVFLYKDKELVKFKTIKDMMHFLFNSDYGLLRRSFVPWLEFMLPNFHPDDQDHQRLLVNYQKI